MLYNTTTSQLLGIQVHQKQSVLKVGLPFDHRDDKQAVKTLTFDKKEKIIGVRASTKKQRFGKLFEFQFIISGFKPAAEPTTQCSLF